MVALPVATPDTTPLPFTVAIPVLPLLHVPGVMLPVNVVVALGQTVVVPEMAGNGFTVNVDPLVAPEQVVTTIFPVPLAPAGNGTEI